MIESPRVALPHHDTCSGEAGHRIAAGPVLRFAVFRAFNGPEELINELGGFRAFEAAD
jgi:hypothetical protein